MGADILRFCWVAASTRKEFVAERDHMFSVETEKMPSVGTGQMASIETRQMTSVEKGQNLMSAAATGQMS